MMVDTGTLTADLDSALEAIEALRTLIERERASLEGRSVDDMEAVATEKEAALMRLQAANPVQHAGLDPATLEEWVRACGDEALLSRWRRFIDGLRAVRRDNERNGIAIRRSLETVAGELRLLHGATGATESSTYGRDGSRRETGGPGLTTTA